MQQRNSALSAWQVADMYNKYAGFVDVYTYHAWIHGRNFAFTSADLVYKWMEVPHYDKTKCGS